MLFFRQIDEGLGVSRSLARCFDDARNSLLIEHSVRELLAQRCSGRVGGRRRLNSLLPTTIASRKTQHVALSAELSPIWSKFGDQKPKSSRALG